MKKIPSTLLGGMAALVLAGCASGPPFIDQMQPQAVDMAVRRAQFDWNCPSATGAVLERQTVQPLAFAGPQRAEYVIGINGCGQRASVNVICSDNGGQCFEGALRR